MPSQITPRPLSPDEFLERVFALALINRSGQPGVRQVYLQVNADLFERLANAYHDLALQTGTKGHHLFQRYRLIKAKGMRAKLYGLAHRGLISLQYVRKAVQPQSARTASAWVHRTNLDSVILQMSEQHARELLSDPTLLKSLRRVTAGIPEIQ